MNRKCFFDPIIKIEPVEEDILMYSDFLVEGDYDYDDAEWEE